jgi:hypothetical protein
VYVEKNLKDYDHFDHAGKVLASRILDSRHRTDRETSRSSRTILAYDQMSIPADIQLYRLCFRRRYGQVLQSV